MPVRDETTLLDLSDLSFRCSHSSLNKDSLRMTESLKTNTISHCISNDSREWGRTIHSLSWFETKPPIPITFRSVSIAAINF